MKSSFITLLLVFLLCNIYAQPQQVPLPEKFRKQYRPASLTPGKTNVHSESSFAPAWYPAETVGTTYYDLQSECCSPSGRVLYFENGTISTVWTQSFDTLDFSDIGTGYAHHDGDLWSEPPTQRIETVPTRDPVIAELNGGEAVLASRYPFGALHMSKRPVAGTGSWEESDLPLPADVTGLIHPKMVTNGFNHSILHVLSQTLTVAKGGVPYQGQDGALLYQRSSDGGQSWDIQPMVIPGTGSDSYNGFSPDTYAMAAPFGNKLAFVVGDPWSDLFVMISEDNGLTWEKTVLWQHPYPFWNGEELDTIYCPDGSVHLAFNPEGVLHVVFGLTSYYSDGNNVYRDPYVGGIAQWKDGQSTWTTGDLYTCLSPELLEWEGSLIGSHLIDWDGNGEWNILGNFGEYGVGPISFPQISFFDDGVQYLVMSSIVENYNNGIQDYRHLLCRSCYFGSNWGTTADLNDDPVYFFSECVYPSISSRPNYFEIYFGFQQDLNPGLSISGDGDVFSENEWMIGILEAPIPGPYVNLSLTSLPTEGGITYGSGIYLFGEEATIEAHPNPGWEFVCWTFGLDTLSTDSIYTFYTGWAWYITAHFRLIAGSTDNFADPVLVFPNPASDQLNFRLPECYHGQSVKLSLSNIQGIKMMEKEYKTDTLKWLNIASFPPGAYLLMLTFEDGTVHRQKLVLK
ncbi:MAG: T9SS type A sorting domain-containing protein [Bacteroidales bacterium]|nr:T9SS type A sorting domain-containing protein [Bacteroidales bacterium]